MTPNEERARAAITRVCHEAQKLLSAEMPRDGAAIVLVLANVDGCELGQVVGNLNVPDRAYLEILASWAAAAIERIKRAEEQTDPPPAGPGEVQP